MVIMNTSQTFSKVPKLSYQGAAHAQPLHTKVNSLSLYILEFLRKIKLAAAADNS